MNYKKAIKKSREDVIETMQVAFESIENMVSEGGVNPEIWDAEICTMMVVAYLLGMYPEEIHLSSKDRITRHTLVSINTLIRDVRSVVSEEEDEE